MLYLSKRPLPWTLFIVKCDFCLNFLIRHGNLRHLFARLFQRRLRKRRRWLPHHFSCSSSLGCTSILWSSFFLPCIYSSNSCHPSHPSLSVSYDELFPFEFHPCVTRHFLYIPLGYLSFSFNFHVLPFWHLTQSGWLPAMPTQFYAYWMACSSALMRLSWKMS